MPRRLAVVISFLSDQSTAGSRALKSLATSLLSRSRPSVSMVRSLLPIEIPSMPMSMN